MPAGGGVPASGGDYERRFYVWCPFCCFRLLRTVGAHCPVCTGKVVELEGAAQPTGAHHPRSGRDLPGVPTAGSGGR